MSFYRIYRPQTITEIDNELVRERLSSLLSKKHKDLPHAYLLFGPKGAGKTTAARIIAKLFNCQESKGKGPCGKCEACKSIAHGTYMDVIEMDGASNRGIEDIRALRERIGLSPSSGTYTIYIIDEVHMLTTEAFNALLKTLEEPPPHAVFVLATTERHKVPVTVRSRCMEIPFTKAKKTELLHALTRIVKKEDIDINAEALDMIADVSEGAFRDAVKLLEQASFSQKPLTPENLRMLLQKSDEGKRHTFLEALFDKNTRRSMDILTGFVKEGSDMKIFISDCLSDLHQYIRDQVMGEREMPWPKADVADLIRRFTESYSLLRSSPIAELPLELLILEYCSMSAPKEEKPRVSQEEKIDPKSVSSSPQTAGTDIDSSDFLTLGKLTSHWADVIEALKPYNHSVAGVMRSTKPKSVEGGTVVIEAFYKFHQERLSDPKVHDILATVLKKLFGAEVKVEIVLGKK